MQFFRIFRRKKQRMQPKQLRIDGVKTELTPEPDDAELAAQALLELRIYGDREQRRKANTNRANQTNTKPQQGTVEYYQQLSEKIRTALEEERRMALRYVAYVEQELALVNGEHKPESIATLEHGLYKFQDVIEREKGGALGEHSETLATKGTQELLKRWQKCLAECILRQMTATEKTTD